MQHAQDMQDKAQQAAGQQKEETTITKSNKILIQIKKD